MSFSPLERIAMHYHLLECSGIYFEPLERMDVSLHLFNLFNVYNHVRPFTVMESKDQGSSVVEKTLWTCAKSPFSAYPQVCETETVEHPGKCSRKLQRKMKSKMQHFPREPTAMSRKRVESPWNDRLPQAQNVAEIRESHVHHGFG